jgi:hypothetical protein
VHYGRLLCGVLEVPTTEGVGSNGVSRGVWRMFLSSRSVGIDWWGDLGCHKENREEVHEEWLECFPLLSSSFPNFLIISPSCVSISINIGLIGGSVCTTMWGDGVCIGATIGGLRYHISIPKMRFWRFSVDIIIYV